ncbi:MAG: glycoside hydrolase family 3 C-terminal domain-containing protein [Bacilli bacterium]|nr:glycoside hydrolase family 3 C-terminal domain-containing protein [Bacilli bacterium]
MKYKDAKCSIPERVEDLLSRMTLDEKLEQMHCFGCVYTPEEELEFIKKGENKIHSEFYTFVSFTIAQLNRIQKFAVEETRLGIPAYIATECVHGAPTPYTTIFPSNGALAATFDLSLAARAARIEGKELKTLGFNRVYSPNVDLLRDGRWGRSGEDYGEDPYLVGKFGAEIVKGLQAEGIEATIKHYIGYSMPEGGLNLGSGHIGEREMREYFLPSFAECIKAGAMGVMNCYNEVDGVPAGVDPLWMTKVLREELGFTGDVITDYGLTGICWHRHQMVNRSEYVLGKIFLDANIDIEACARDAYGPQMKEMVESGEVDIERINTAVRRVLTNKFKLGLFDNPYVPEVDEFNIRTKEAHDLTYEIEAKGAVLLKNDGILPFKEKKNILLVGPNSMIAQLGGICYFPFAQDGKHEFTCSAAKAVKTHEAFINKYGKDNVKVIPCCNFMNVNNEQIKEAVELANTWADVVIFAGGNNAQGYSGGENGGANNPVNLPDACTSNEGYDTDDICICKSQKTVFKALKEAKAPIVFLIYEGKPCSLTEELDDISALIYCFGVGMEGNRAIADIIAGDVVPSGKMTFTIPRTVGQIPIFYNRKPLRGLYDRSGNDEKAGQDYVFSDKEPLFEFGAGLSYTTFEYSDLKVEKVNDEYKVSVKVANTGDYDADESVLVYTGSLSNVMVAPCVKKLRAFKRIHLNKGESQVVEFTLTKEDWAYVGYDMKTAYPIGQIKVIVKDMEAVFHI